MEAEANLGRGRRERGSVKRLTYVFVPVIKTKKSDEPAPKCAARAEPLGRRADSTLTPHATALGMACAVAATVWCCIGICWPHSNLSRPHTCMKK